MTYRRVASLKATSDFGRYLTDLALELPFDEEVILGEGAPMAQGVAINGLRIGNRFAILPMEGWDGTADGRPTELTQRRWRRFGESGAKLIWGGEAVAVRSDGRANPHQLLINDATWPELSRLREQLVFAHSERFGTADDLVVGLQLTHSGRFARPNDQKRLEPLLVYRHPILDGKFGISDPVVMSDASIEQLIEDFARAAALAQRAGFHFVDVKHCHGYLGHEFLTAWDRLGPYGGSLENRTRFLKTVIDAIRTSAPGLNIGVRLSAFDFVPFRGSEQEAGQPEPFDGTSYRYAFGGDGSGVGIDLSEPGAVLDLLASLGVHLLCVSAGSPYYTPHIQRPALFPPSDGYAPPEDPLCGVARQITVTGKLKRRRPDLLVVGSGYSYLQQWLPHVAQAVVRTGGADVVGIGRLALSYPEFVADVLAGRPLAHKQLCRTLSDCTTAPRNGLVSGCFPLDPYYRSLPEAQTLAQLKSGKRAH
ncbi:MAG TPA: hypothetical protein VGJ84_17015 [Polyangiaceae bacterium]|jgi:2,4-dienoyl-CoA reductase-like NADH-dependent reductase (Old Yellow Enzyme family)